MSKTTIEPTFAPFIEACRVHGIGKTKAYELVEAGLLETFLIGTTRYVVLESMRTLPERMKRGEKK